MSNTRDPTNTLDACERILILGRTGSGKTTLARQLAAALHVPHVELDSLYFGPEFSTAPLPLLRERTSAAIAGDRCARAGALVARASRGCPTTKREPCATWSGLGQTRSCGSTTRCASACGG